MLKRVVAFLLISVFVVSFAGCASKNSESASQTAEKSSTSQTEKAQSDESENSEIEGQISIGADKTIVNTNDITIIYNGIKETDYGLTIDLKFVNNSKYDYAFKPKDVLVNDIKCKSVSAIEADSKGTVGYSFLLEPNGSGSINISDVKKITLSFKIFDTGDTSHSFNTKKVTFKP